MNYRISLRLLLPFFGLLIPIAWPAGPASANCDPNGPTLDKVERLATLGKFNDALTLVNSVANQQDFRVNYVKGKVLYLKAALADPNRWNPPLPLSPTMADGFRILVATAARLSSLDAACAGKINAYGILNTIGAFYLNRGYFKDAQDYLLQAYANDSKITSQDTRRKIRDNLGLVYLVQREPDLAIRYYNEALAFHSTVASTQIAKAIAIKKARVAPMIAK